MNIAQISGFILICLMIRLVYLTTRFVSSASYNGNGIYHITINAWFRGNKRYREWLRKNTIYHWCILLVIALCPIIILLIEPFRQNEMVIRPEVTIFFNMALWLAILKRDRWFYDNYSER